MGRFTARKTKKRKSVALRRKKSSSTGDLPNPITRSQSMESLPTICTSKHYVRWTTEEVSEWVDTNIDFLNGKSFILQDIDGMALSKLTESHLKEMFPKMTVGQRIKFKHEISRLSSAQTSFRKRRSGSYVKKY